MTRLPPTPPEQPSYWRDYVATGGLAIWIVLLVLQYWNIESLATRVELRETGGLRSFKIASLISFGVLLLAGRFPWPLAGPRRITFDLRVSLVLFFLSLQLVLSPLSVDPLRSGIYSTTSILLFLGSIVVWSGDQNHIRRTLEAMSFAIWIILTLLVLRHGVETRSVGGIQPNQFARVALVGMMAGSFREGWLRRVSIVLAIGFSLLVSSRSSFLAAIVFAATIFALGRKTHVKLAVVGTIIFSVLILDLHSFMSLGRSRIASEIDEVLLITDPARGVDSGFTNRFEFWRKGLQGIADRPVIGYGFRTRRGVHSTQISTVSAHNAYLNLILDTGVVGAFIFLAAILVDCVRRISLLASIRRWLIAPRPDRSRIELQDDFEFNRVVLAAIVSTLALWISEPTFLHIGMAYPVFFQFMLAAPYSTRGARHPGLSAERFRQIPRRENQAISAAR